MPQTARTQRCPQRIVDTNSNSYDKAGVDAVGERLAAELEADGILTKRLPVEGFGDVMLAEVPGATGKPVLLLGHRDTVFPKGTTADRGFSRDATLAYGPGVADMKGGLVLNCFSRIENGLISPTYAVLSRLCDALKIRWADMPGPEEQRFAKGCRAINCADSGTLHNTACGIYESLGSDLVTKSLEPTIVDATPDT